MSTASPGQKSLNKSQNSNEAYKYFGSDAEKIRAFPETPTDADDNKQYIILVSLVVFMIYFFILRESNDIDEALGRDLFDHFGPEASRLKKAYDYNIKNNLPTEEITNRLREIGAPVPPGI